MVYPFLSPITTPLPQLYDIFSVRTIICFVSWRCFLFFFFFFRVYCRFDSARNSQFVATIEHLMFAWLYMKPMLLLFRPDWIKYLHWLEPLLLLYSRPLSDEPMNSIGK